MSIRPTLPPELTNNVLKLYRECLRRANTFGNETRELIVTLVQTQFRFNMHETDPEKIQKCKDNAIRGVIDHIIYEEAKKKPNQTTDQSS